MSAFMFKTAILILLLSGVTSAVELQIDSSMKNKVTFISDAPLEDIEGVTDQIDGYVYWENNIPLESADSANSEFVFEVTLENLDTGLGLRNRHLRENYLHTDRFPYARFEGYIQSVNKIRSDSLTIVAVGQFSCHGQEQIITIRPVVTITENRYRVHCEFDINLNDYNIEIPRLMFLKVNDTVKIVLDFYLEKTEVR